jgi:hypothetical protein
LGMKTVDCGWSGAFTNGFILTALGRPEFL